MCRHFTRRQSKWNGKRVRDLAVARLDLKQSQSHHLLLLQPKATGFVLDPFALVDLNFDTLFVWHLLAHHWVGLAVHGADKRSDLGVSQTCCEETTQKSLCWLRQGTILDAALQNKRENLWGSPKVHRWSLRKSPVCFRFFRRSVALYHREMLPRSSQNSILATVLSPIRKAAQVNLHWPNEWDISIPDAVLCQLSRALQSVQYFGARSCIWIAKQRNAWSRQEKVRRCHISLTG